MPWTIMAPGYGYFGGHQPWSEGTAPPSANSPSMLGLWYWSSSAPPYVDLAADATTEPYEPSPREPRGAHAPRSLANAMFEARNREMLPTPEDFNDFRLLTAGIVNRFGAFIEETMDLDSREREDKKDAGAGLDDPVGGHAEERVGLGRGHIEN